MADQKASSDSKQVEVSSDSKQVHKAVTEMTLGELKEFVREFGDKIGIEVSRTETFNTKYTALPRGQIISDTEKKG